LVLEPKIALTGYRKSYPRNLKMFSNLTFDLKSIGVRAKNSIDRV
jgi:hypothetical protein